MPQAQHAPGQSRADLEFTASSFGGGWLRPLSDAGRDFIARHMDVEPGSAPPHPCGYIVEPWAVRELAEWAQVEGLASNSDGEG